MTKISAKVIADSKNEFGNRITTMVVTFPRFILAELNTHRMLSKNSASSRAIPFEKMVKSVEENPFIPIAWQKDHKGMQGNEYLTSKEHIEDAELEWFASRDWAIDCAKRLNSTGVTKQLCNRLLEPFMWHTVLITATEWENFFYLRCPQYSLFHENMPISFRSKKDFLSHVHKVEAPEFKNQYDNLTELDWLQINKGQAEIHMMALAEAMWDAYNESTPKELKAGEWHIPFGDDIETNKVVDYFDKNGFSHMTNVDYQNTFIKIATARCARVSYTVVGEEDKPANYENDIKLHDRLAESGHWSPFEHCAQVMSKDDFNAHFMNDETDPDSCGWSGNFRGFVQYRKTFNNENITK